MSSSLFMDQARRRRATSVVLRNWITNGTFWPGDEICRLDVDGEREVVRWQPPYVDYGCVVWVYVREGEQVRPDGRILEFSTNMTRGHDPRTAPYSFAFLPTDVLLVQAVVEKGDKTAEGDHVIAVLPAWEEIIRLIEKDPRVVYEIDARRWEEIIAASYEKHGFDEVILTPRSGDFGRDVIAVKHGYWSVRIVESVKRYAPDRLVRADDVRALLGVVAGDPKASKGVISTTSDFAPRINEDPLLSPHIPYRIELVNGPRLIARLSRALIIE